MMGQGLVLAVLSAAPVSFDVTAQAQTTAPHTAPSADAMSSADRTALVRALSAYDQGQPDQAKPVLEKLVRQYPRNFEATETLGLIHADGGDFAAALPLLEKASAIRPSSGLALANLGAAYLKLNRNADAIRVLDRAAILDPRNRETQSALGQALMLVGRPADAATAFAAASADGPPDPDLLYNWALALLNAGKTKRAAEVVATIPHPESSAQVQSLWGDIEEKNGNFGTALEHDQRAAELDPSETNLYALALELMRDGLFPAAGKILDYAVAKYPQSARLQFGFGLAKYGSDDYQGSAAVFSALLQREPQSNLYADLLGRNCIMIDQWQNTGCDALEQAVTANPANASAALYLAERILRRPEIEQDTTRARTLLDQVVHTNPKLAEAWFQEGILDQQQMQWQQSARMLEKAVALEPTFAQAHYRLARAYAHIGKREEALHEIALEKKYSSRDESSQTMRMREVTAFLTASH